MSSWFIAATLSGIACALLAVAVVVAGWRRRIPEVAMLGAGLFSISVLATSFGMGGTSFGEGPAEWAAVLALPIGVIAAGPILAPSAPWSLTLARAWRPWVAGATVGALGLAVVLFPTSRSVPSPAVVGLLAFGLMGASMLVRRQLLLFRVSGRRAALVTASSVTTIAISSACGMAVMPGSGWSWMILLAENIGVLGAGVAVIAGYHTGRGVSDVLGPLLSREPLAALDVGLAPEVHAFVAALADKDQITRDHVVRTSALAMRTAIRSGSSSALVREVALGALLHDIGKLVVPSDIINKPGKLNDDEFRLISSHPAQGERLLETAPSLAAAARYVRGHHERVDGRGYPDGLAGDAISFEVGLVSVADAWDAMTHTRQYREGMSLAKAESILRAGADTQWRLDAVECLLAEVRAGGQVEIEPLHRLGDTDVVRDASPFETATCPCDDALPADWSDDAGALADPMEGIDSPTRDTERFTSSLRAALATANMPAQLISVRVAGLDRVEFAHGATGALMIRAAEQLVAAATRDDDMIARWAPGQIVIALPSASVAAANEMARRIRVASEELAAMSADLEHLRLEVSTLVVHRDEVDSLDLLLDDSGRAVSPRTTAPTAP